jgi:uncharacterized protein
MSLALLTLTLELLGCASLKDKRSRIKPILIRVHREFNVSTAEISLQDVRNRAGLAFCVVNENAVICHNLLSRVLSFIESQWPDLLIIQDKIEII